ncbi:hypothetical protein RY831_03935 [Noviherbaspirillum sp. CPCC 100848]|uniref:Uncharacterized protein n=1 Tax=Noviherbaspirillum album TaxID=3080276 RepID=A0ABU6J4I1_9BURK|nr:hypothetical protein [Noviherbaspirillum sp. CPCC 100848]MEC4718285.1 hypothetical protein [Noviherbaspirillum sp. CPCC 100848]
MYKPHPSDELRQHFAERPYQGADPMAAKLLFVGLDANYDEAIAKSPAFTSVLEYHQDGVAFWRRYGVHHPFLLPYYRGDGRRYHQTFAKIGFQPDHAHLVSFVELLHLPTVGRSQLVPADLDSCHVKWLDNVIRAGEAQHIFVSAGVLRLMQSTDQFHWLRGGHTPVDSLPVLYDDGRRKIYRHLHFSNYGKFQAQLERERMHIGALLSLSSS